MNIDKYNFDADDDPIDFNYTLVDEETGQKTELDKDNKEFFQALELVRTTNELIYVTGKAGTGKTTFLKYLKKNIYKNSVVLAYTGVAAVNAGGQTINSFFKISPNEPPFVPNDNRLRFRAPLGDKDTTTIFNHFQYNFAKIDLLRSLQLLIIDEISMVRADFLDVIDKILRSYRRKLSIPFGGVQVVLIGDTFQLSPIEGNDWEFLKEHYESSFFFDSKIFKASAPIYIELKKIYRQDQKVEGEFISLLNRVRTAQPAQKDIELLNNKVKPFTKQLFNEGYIYLCSTNKPANEINETQLSSLPSPGVMYTGVVEKEFNLNSLPTDMNLQLKVGAQVMFLKNGEGYYNGKICKISFLSSNTVKAIIKGSNGQDTEIEVEKAVWENVRFKLNTETQKIEKEVVGTFTQYPLKLAWAITIHKSQGLTFDKVSIDIPYMQRFNPSGLVYVALSRCRSFNGVILNRPMDRRSIYVDPKVISFAESETPETFIDEVLKSGRADEYYKLARKAFKMRRLESAFNHLADAAKLRNDLQTDLFKRYIITHLQKYKLKYYKGTPISTSANERFNILVKLISGVIESNEPLDLEYNNILKAFENSIEV